MNTILNLGLNDEAVVGLANATGHKRFAYDAYRRLINMYGDVVCGVDHEHFEVAFDKIKKRYKATVDNEVPLEGMVELCEEYKNVFKKALTASHSHKSRSSSWNWRSKPSSKAGCNPEPSSIAKWKTSLACLGTAVNCQSMVFGNMGDESGTGVAFTRNPSTGENKFYGEFLVNAQGEDVVAGIRTPEPVEKMAKWNKKVYDQLMGIKDQLEKHYRDVQDIEFTIENNTLFMLQTRNGKRTGAAAVKIACDMVKEKLITEQEAVIRIPAGDLTQLLLPSFSPAAKQAAKKEGRLLTVGLPASPGAAVGKLGIYCR